MKKSLLATAAVASIGLAGLVSAAPATALACGTPALLVNGWNDSTSTDVFWWYGADGSLLQTIETTQSTGYGDVALSPDAQTIYGVSGGVVDLLDANTGALKSTLTLTGPAADSGLGWDGAAIIGDGSMIIGSPDSNLAFKVDVTTGASTEFVNYATDDSTNDPSNPQYYYTTGDFSQLPDGDVVVLYSNADADENYLARVHPDGSMTTVGQVPLAWGAGRVLDDIQFAQYDGIISKIAIADIPTAASTSMLTAVTIVDTGRSNGAMGGAAGTQDSGTQTCPAALPDTGLNGSQALAGGLFAAGLALTGAAGIAFARRKRA